MRKNIALAIVAALAIALPLSADEEPEGKKVDPPAAVKASIEKAHPGAKIVSCHEETEDGKTEYCCEVQTKDGKKIEVDCGTDGKILNTEEKIDVGAVPAAVMKAFQAKYKDAKVTEAWKETESDGKIFYELEFKTGDASKEAKFAADGTFVEEEDEDD